MHDMILKKTTKKIGENNTKNIAKKRILLKAKNLVEASVALDRPGHREPGAVPSLRHVAVALHLSRDKNPSI